MFLHGIRLYSGRGQRSLLLVFILFMFTHNTAMYGIKILTELMKDIFYFPLWWYTRGLKNCLIFLKNFIVNREKSLALLVWIKNIHVPMYGQSDWQGRLISFFIRLFQVIIRSLVMIVWLLFSFFVFLLWLIFPLFALYQIFLQII